jgi:selenide,water dikinase
MGGRPLTAMNIVCFPIGDLDGAVLRSILQGGLETISRAGAILVGGHSVEDPELKYGLSITGVVHPQKFLTNAGAKPGDRLILTKPLGTGILATALKAKQLDRELTGQITEMMAALNRGATEAMLEIGANACTDITGFGLLGHALEMARASGVGMRIDTERVPIIPEARTFAAMGLVPGGSQANRGFCAKDLEIDPSVDPVLLDILTDPQTSGGLLIAVPEKSASALVQKLIAKNTHAASIIGEITAEPPGKIQCR